MEPFKQHDGNQYSKRPEKIDVYLNSIIQRFFDTRKANNDIAIEQIITAAMARYKGSINYKDKGVRSINGKEGIIFISVHTLKLLGKEPHKTAFNKNFGSALGTICSGDDIRLNDDRNPKDHAHQVKEIQNLGMVLHSLNTKATSYGRHEHQNKNVLDKITCTSKTDLKDIEDANKILTEKCKTLEQKLMELENIKTQYEHYLKRIKAVKGI